MRLVLVALVLSACVPPTEAVSPFPAPPSPSPAPSAQAQVIAIDAKGVSSPAAVDRPVDPMAAHREECASTYRSRFIDTQKAAAIYADMKPKLDSRCKELAKHCSTFSSGNSVCHGLTGQEQAAFDQFCSGTFRVAADQNEECADVDPEHLVFDLTWSAVDARAFSKRTPP